MERNNWLWRKSRCFASLLLPSWLPVCVVFTSGTLHLVESSFRSPSATTKLSLLFAEWHKGLFISPLSLFDFTSIWPVSESTFSHVLSRWGARLFHGAALCRGFETWPLDITSRSVKRSTRAGILLACISVDQREGLGELMPEPDVWCDKWFRGSDLFFREWNHTAGTVVLAKG